MGRAKISTVSSTISRNNAANVANTKQCSMCKEIKGINEFNFKNKEKEIRASYCRPCLKKYHLENYQKRQADPETHAKDTARRKKNNEASRARLKAWFEEQKRGKICANCGIDDPSLLEFHHLDPTTKVDAVANMVSSSRSKEVITAEIAKCETLCGNCHAIETQNTVGTWRANGIPSDQLISDLTKQMKAIPLTDEGAAAEKAIQGFKLCPNCVTTAKAIGAACPKCNIRFSQRIYANRIAKRTPLRDRVGAAKVKQFIGEYLKDCKCVDCKTDNWRVLQFDHVGDDKEFNIGDAITRVSLKRIIAEIRKCETVCTNCHKGRTTKRLE